MGRCYQIKRSQFESDKQRLEDLTAEHDEITQQLGYENNAAERLRLERQQIHCREQMDKLAQQCDQLERDLQQLQAKEEVLQTLIHLLTPIKFETVTQAYRSCLPEGRPRPVPETLESLLRQLAEIPGEPDQPQLLLRFVNLLSQDRSLQPDQQKVLRDWVRKQGLSSVALDQPEIVETCLMVKVQPRSLNDPSLGYLLSAAVVQDPDPLKLEVERVETAIAVPESTNFKYAPGYADTDLPIVLSELVTICGRDHGIPLTDLTVQWFLPIELMSLPIEHWQIRIGKNQEQCSGQRCKAVIVRSYDRHFSPDYLLAVGDWKKYWNRLSPCQGSSCTTTLVTLDPKTKKTTIDWNKPHVIGCKFMEHDEQQQQENFWDHLLGQGVPVALWTRQVEADPKMAKRIMQSVSKCSIAGLPLSLATQRKKALSELSEADRLRAAPLCLLWDNPFRPFPNIDYQSA